MRGFRLALLIVSSLGCAPAPLPAELSLSLSRRGTAITAKAVATDELGKIGAGNVEFVSMAGSPESGASIALDSYGTATAEFACDVSTEPACEDVSVQASWKPAGSKTATIASATS